VKTFCAILAFLVATSATDAQTPVVPKSFTGAKQPQAAIRAPSEDVFVTFGKGDAIYVTRSTNSAKSFDTSQLVAAVPQLALGMRRGPRIAVTDESLLVSAVSRADGNLYCWGSTNNGTTWSKGVRINDEPGAAREGLHAMAADRQFVAIAWLDLRTGKTELRGVISQDNGVTWSTNFLIYRSPDGHICECCHPSLAWDAYSVGNHQPKVFAMWRNCLGGARDMFLTTLQLQTPSYQKGPEIFSDVELSNTHKLGTETWRINSCPMDGGGLACEFAGFPIAVWRQEKKIFCLWNLKETRISDSGSQPCAAVARNHFWIVYQDGEKLISVRNTFAAGKRSTDAAKIIAEHGKYPAVAGHAIAKFAIAVWETGDSDSPIAAKILP
jgi:hypothetical protein